MKKFLLRLHPVIRRHHLMSLDHLLWMIHQEDHQSQKIKRVIKEIWVTVFPLWTFWNHVFRQSSHIMAAYMNFVISLCAGIHKFQIWCHCCLFWDLTWFHQNRYTFFGYPLDLRSFFTNQYKYTVPLDETSGFICMHMSDFFWTWILSNVSQSLFNILKN